MKNTLRVRRAEREVNQFKAAKALGMHRDRYLRIEKDYTDPTEAEQAAMVRYFGVPHEVLFPPAVESGEAVA